ncbi:hypothetical protein LTR65_009515 [Meristemomyces frigidus]
MKHVEPSERLQKRTRHASLEKKPKPLRVKKQIDAGDVSNGLGMQKLLGRV